MIPDRLLIVRESAGPQKPRPGWLVTTFSELFAQLGGWTAIRQLGRYREARLYTYRDELMHRPLESALLLRLFCRGPCAIEDESGAIRKISPDVLLRYCSDWARDHLRAPGLLWRIKREVRQLTRDLSARRSPGLDLSGRPVYCRTDLVFGLRSGGSVTHVAGVLNHLGAFSGPPIFLTTDLMPGVSPTIETHLIAPGPDFRSLREVRNLHFTGEFAERAQRLLGRLRLSFLYQRYSLGNYSGVHLARRLGLPFVLEFNGAEVWVNRHWGKRLHHEAVSEQIEQLNLLAADLVVVVSEPLQQELVHRGIPAERILINPNGVDADRYAPSASGSEIRTKYHLGERIVIGFIGTFGRWHGAEVLAAAFVRLLREQPEYRGRVCLLMIGDGVTMPQVKAVLQYGGAASACVFTGLVPQAEGPNHLAACDILVAPHVPNPDGTRFIGSPTKLFEYMAMGKGIVASDLEQIGEVLEHDRTAWLVPPGDEGGLLAGLRRLLDQPALRTRLGGAARQEVLSRYTWRQHTARIVNKLQQGNPAVGCRAKAG